MVEQETLEALAKFFEAMQGLPRVFGEMLGEVTKNSGGNQDVKALMKSMKQHGAEDPGYMPPYFIPKDYSVKDFEDEFHKLGGVGMVTSRVVKGPYAGAVVCFVREEDLLLAQIAKERALSMGQERQDSYGNLLSHTTKVSLTTLKTTLTENGYTRPLSLKGLNDVQAKFLNETLRTSGVIYSEKTNTNGEHDVYFSPKDRGKIKNCLARMAIEFHGESGSRSYVIQKNSILSMNKVLQHMDKSKTDEPFYVVSANNVHEVIHVHDRALEHMCRQADGESKIYRRVNTTEDYNRLNSVFKEEAYSMKNPVVLTASEYEAAQHDPEELKKLVFQKRGLPPYSSDLSKLHIHMENEIKSAFVKKVSLLSLDNSLDINFEKSLLEDVKAGKMSLVDYLNQGVKPVDKDLLSDFSDDELKASIGLVESFVEEYDSADELLRETNIDPQEYEMDLDELVAETEVAHEAPALEDLEVGDD